MTKKILFVDQFATYSIELFHNIEKIILKNNKFDISFVGPKDENKMPYMQKASKNAFRIWSYDDYVWKIYNFTKTAKPEIIHFGFELKTYGPIRSLIKFPILLFLLKRQNIKIIVSFYNIFVYRKNGKWEILPYTIFHIPKFVWKFCAKMFIKIINTFSDKIIVASGGAKDALKEFYKIDEEKIKVIRVGVSDEKTELTQDKIQRIKHQFENKKIILCFGVISPRKGQDVIISAFSKIISEIPEHVLVITGKAPNEYSWFDTKIRKLVKTLGIENKVFFTGFVDDEERDILFSIADFTVFAYQPMSDGTYALTFSMQYEKPAIVTKTETFLDVIKENEAVYVEPNNESELMNAIKKLANDNSLKVELSKKMKVLSQKYSWSKSAESSFEVYRDI